MTEKRFMVDAGIIRLRPQNVPHPVENSVAQLKKDLLIIIKANNVSLKLRDSLRDPMDTHYGKPLIRFSEEITTEKRLAQENHVRPGRGGNDEHVRIFHPMDRAERMRPKCSI